LPRPRRSARPAAPRSDAAPAAPPAPSQPSPWKRLITSAPWKLALGLALLHLALAAAAFNPIPHPGGDNAAYVALARSLLQRHAYLELWDPAMRPHSQYPPLWPALIALLSLVGVKGLAALKGVTVGLSALSVGVAYLWMRRAAPPVVALCAGLVLAVCPGVLDLSHWELSDVPAWALSMLALWASTHLGTPAEEGEEPAQVRGRTRWFALMVVAAVLSSFTRSAGLPLVVAVAVWLGLRRDWRRLGVLGAAYLPLTFLWWLRARRYAAPGYTSHLWAVDPYRPELGRVGWGGIFERMGDNLGRYVDMHLPKLLIWEHSRLLGISVLVLAMVGWGWRLRHRGVAEIWVPLYAGLLLIWPATWSGERFLLPLLPLLLCYAFEYLQTLGRELAGPRVVALAPVVAAGLLIGLAGPGISLQIRAGAHCRGEWRRGENWACMNQAYHDYFRIAEMTRGQLPPGSAVLTRKATLFYLLSGYPARTYPLSANPDTFFAAASAAGARYVEVDALPDLAPLYLHPVLVKARYRFCSLPRLRIQDAALLRIEPPSPPPAVPVDTFAICDQVPRPPASP
jgi:hypothetical protein